MEIKKEGDHYCVWGEVDPHDEQLLGALRKGEDGYFRFHPARATVLTCQQLIVICRKVSEFNVEGGR